MEEEVLSQRTGDDKKNKVIIWSWGNKKEIQHTKKNICTLVKLVITKYVVLKHTKPYHNNFLLTIYILFTNVDDINFWCTKLNVIYVYIHILYKLVALRITQHQWSGSGVEKGRWPLTWRCVDTHMLPGVVSWDYYEALKDFPT